MKGNSRKDFVFRAQHFYALLDKQKYSCPLTGRELTPENTTAEHIIPLKRGGVHTLANIFLIDDKVAKLKRFMTSEEVVRLAAEIIEASGKQFGISLRRKGR